MVKVGLNHNHVNRNHNAVNHLTMLSNKNTFYQVCGLKTFVECCVNDEKFTVLPTQKNVANIFNDPNTLYGHQNY